MLALAGATPIAVVPPQADEEVRALWVTRTTLTSPESMSQMVAAAKAGGFNTLLVQVRGRGDAYYRSTLEPRAAELSAQARLRSARDVTSSRRTPPASSVHAWVAVNLVSSPTTLPLVARSRRSTARPNG